MTVTTTAPHTVHAPRPAHPGAPARPLVTRQYRIAVRVHSLDPISEAGILVQLRQRPELRIAESGEAASVIVAIVDALDEAATRWLTALHRADGDPVVLVIGQLDPRATAAIAGSGVCGVLRRAEATPERLVRVVRAAAQGHGDMPPELVRHLLDQVSLLSRTTLEPRGLSFAGLTERERDVLKLIADGLSTREVAMKLSYSERTIKAVLQALTIRLNLRNRTQAVAYAVRNGWI
ncbi:helix-turn-helix transcriptional regulator [Actinocrinis puniceicyclus]|nr:response regulator transcription factor [Actinocrinis puniceicyclus]